MRKTDTPTYPRDHAPWDLEPHYSHHVGAMTEERLHDKADIAFQLALRDKRIAELEALRVVVCKHGRVADKCRACVAERPDSEIANAEALAGLRRIVRRALACGQLEKLEDAKRYLDDDGQAEWLNCPRHCCVDHEPVRLVPGQRCPECREVALP